MKTKYIIAIIVILALPILPAVFHGDKPDPQPAESPRAPAKEVPWGYVCAALNENEVPPKCIEWKTVFKGGR